MEGQSDEQGRLEAEQARLEAVEEEETVRMHLAALKREELALQASGSPGTLAHRRRAGRQCYAACFTSESQSKVKFELSPALSKSPFER